MAKNKRIKTYLDGFLSIYRINGDNKSTFGAKKNIKSLDEMTHVIDLAYSQTTKRVQDLEFSESIGRDLSLKVKTRLVHVIKNDDKAIIDNILYDIIYIDEDRTNRELYIYLEEVREIE